MKILIVDDHKVTRKLIIKYLSCIGDYEYFEASDGNSGIEVLNHNMGIKLVFCDWMMKGMDGLEMLTIMKSSSTLKDIPFVMVSNSITTRDIQVAMDAGASDYITKPFSPGALIKVTKEYL